MSDDKLVEQFAKIIHDTMVHAVREFKGEPQPWQNGNSTAESYARSEARAILTALQSEHASMEGEIAGWVEREAKRFDPHSTGVVRGDPDGQFSDDPRVSVSQYRPDEGEPQRITIGLFLGEHRWAMAEFTPEQARGIAAVILSKPAVAALTSSKTGDE